ncbi:hypothetical protein Tco_1522725 [Tanacetum coccineum]
MTSSVSTEMTRSVPTEMTRSVSTEVTRSVPTDMTRSVSTKMTRLVSTEVTRSVQTKMTRSFSTEMTRSVPTKMTRSVSTEVTRSVPTEMTRSVSTEMTRSVPTEMTRSVSTEVTRSVPTEMTRSKATHGSSSNPLIANFKKRNKQGTIEYHLQQVKNSYLKWRELPSAERQAYCERLSKLQGKGFGIPRVSSWTLFYNYNIEETLKNKMKYEYLHDDGDVFVDFSWEIALSIYGYVYPEWCLEFFSTMYFDKWVDRTKLMTEKCIWFRLCGVEKVLTLPEFAVLLGLYEEEELNHRSTTTWASKKAKTRTKRVRLELGRLELELEQTDQSNFAYPAYEPPNVPLYHYPYVPYPYPYTHYPDTGCPSFGVDHYGAHGDGYHAGFIIPSSGYKIGGSSTGFHGDDFDPIMHSEDYVESDDDKM